MRSPSRSQCTVTPSLAHVGAHHLRAHVDLESLLAEDLVRLTDHVVVVAHEDRGGELHHRDLRAEPPPHRAELQPDHAAADHHEVAGHLADRQRAHVGVHAAFVEREERELHRHRARGEDHVRALHVAHRAVLGPHLDHVARLERALAAGPGDLVLPEQELHTLGVLLHHVQPCAPASSPGRGARCPRRCRAQRRAGATIRSARTS